MKPLTDLYLDQGAVTAIPLMMQLALHHDIGWVVGIVKIDAEGIHYGVDPVTNPRSILITWDDLLATKAMRDYLEEKGYDTSGNFSV